MGSRTRVVKGFLCPWTLVVLALTISATTLGSTGPDGQVNPNADQWITNAVVFPAGILERDVLSNGFASVRAEVRGERLKIFWLPERPLTNATVTVHASADELGHWPVRDWRSYLMSPCGNVWEVFMPVDNIEVPLVYFVTAVETKTPSGNLTNSSPMRICNPRLAGLEAPTRIFWPFLEGFEQDAASWRLLSAPDESASLKTDSTAHTGRVALAVRLPEGKRSVAIATTRIRGWQLLQNNATGVRVWLRTRQGTARARFTLFADAFATNQLISVWPNEPLLTDEWQKVEFRFSSLAKSRLSSVDLLAIEFIAQGQMEFLVDDLELLGPWKTVLDLD